MDDDGRRDDVIRPHAELLRLRLRMLVPGETNLNVGLRRGLEGGSSYGPSVAAINSVRTCPRRKRRRACSGGRKRGGPCLSRLHTIGSAYVRKYGER